MRSFVFLFALLFAVASVIGNPRRKLPGEWLAFLVAGVFAALIFGIGAAGLAIGGGAFRVGPETLALLSFGCAYTVASLGLSAILRRPT